MQIFKDKMDSHTRDEERVANDKKAQRVPDTDIVNVDESLSLRDQASEQISGSIW